MNAATLPRTQTSFFTMPRQKAVEETRQPPERKEKRFTTYLTPSFEKVVLNEAAKLQLDPTQFGRDALEFYLAYKDKVIDNPRSFRGKFLTKAPAGPWDKALEHAGSFTVSEDTAEELQVRDGDVFVRAVGESMEAAGIWDNAMLLMRPMGTRAPRRNDIVLVEVQTEDGEHFGTIKHWQPGSTPSLTDGEGNDFPLPENTINVRAVAELQGIIALH